VPILDNHHFARHVGGSKIDGETVDGSAFRVRSIVDADGLSGNWPEYFKGKSLEGALIEIRKAYAAKGRTIGATSKFAILSIGGTRDSVRKKAGRSIDFVDTPDLPLDPSHASITGYNPDDDIIADIIAQTVIRLLPGRA
jgi:hypothetical protein